MSKLEIRPAAEHAYSDILSPEVRDVLEALALLDSDRKAIMARRIKRRTERARDKRRLGFLDPDGTIPRTTITVKDARAGRFVGSEIPADLRRQWIQGTGPAAKPHAPIDKSIRNIAYALLS